MKNTLFVLGLFGLLSCNTANNQEHAAGNDHGHHHDSDEAHEHHDGHDGNHEGDHHDGDAGENKPKSPKQTTTASVGENQIQIEYSAPSVRGRTIYGGLVAYDEVWVTGAHKATNITFEKDVNIEGTQVSAGTYGFFTIPGKAEWTLILNEDWDMHLASKYTPEHDVVRITVQPETLKETTEQLVYTITPHEEGDHATLSITWDTVKVSFELSNAS